MTGERSTEYDDELVAHWQPRLNALAQQAGVEGAVLGIDAGGRRAVVTHGVVSTRTRVEVTRDTVFQIGSITKTWTATMIAQLVSEGRLSTSSTVAALLPGVPLGSPDAAHEITVEHLLTHGSGLDGDVFTDTGRGDDCIERYVDLLADVTRAFAPGAAYSYCNSGFVVLGRIIEVLDGRSWDESLQVRLIEPLGLRDTVTLPEDALLRRAAVGHRPAPASGEAYDTWMLPRSIGPAGLIAATAGDLLAYARMHLEGGVASDGSRVLDADVVADLQRERLAVPPGAGFAGLGLSWRRYDWHGTPVVGHDGGTIGQLAYLRLAPEHDFACCLLTNSSASAALIDPLLCEIGERHLGVRPPSRREPADVDLPAELLARHAGTYARHGVRYDVSVEDAGLVVVATDTDELADLEADPTERFVLHPTDASGSSYVTRRHESEPWTAFDFGALRDGQAYAFRYGRVTPRV